MKITDSDNIKTGENDFIDNLLGELDWSVIEQLLKDKYNLRLHDDIEYKNGDIVVHANKVAYKLDFDVRVTLSLLFGRDGECLDISTSGEVDADGEELSEDAYSDSDVSSETVDSESDSMEPIGFKVDSKDLKQINTDKVANQIADMLGEING